MIPNITAATSVSKTKNDAIIEYYVITDASGVLYLKNSGNMGLATGKKSTIRLFSSESMAQSHIRQASIGIESSDKSTREYFQAQYGHITEKFRRSLYIRKVTLLLV